MLTTKNRIPDILPTPHGEEEIFQTFGDPDGDEKFSLELITLPFPLELSWEGNKATRLYCHSLVAPRFLEVLQTIQEMGLEHLLVDYGGCYAKRRMRGGTKWSTHSWGIAIDLNTKTNRLGSHGDMPAIIVDIFLRNGFEWGGNWKRPDPMHFQYATGY